MAQVFGAEIRGGDVGSSEVTFIPDKVREAAVRVDMRTAASITLFLQAAIPAIALSGAQASLDVIGGTDVPWSPTYDYLEKVVRPAYELIGIKFASTVQKRGYYPKGGGRVTVQVQPASSVMPLDLTFVDTQVRAHLVSRCANLPRHIAERQLNSMERSLASEGIGVSSRTVSVEKALSPGSSVLAFSVEGGRFVGADAIGSRGRPAEEVGKQAGDSFTRTVKSGSTVDLNLADMVAPLLCIAEEPSVIRILQSTLHLKTVLFVAGLFTGSEYGLEGGDGSTLLAIRPRRGHNA
jgi:RNA 3'-phosphate cyclase